MKASCYVIEKRVGRERQWEGGDVGGYVQTYTFAHKVAF